MNESNIKIDLEVITTFIDKKDLLQVVKLHKESFDKTIATTLSDQKLFKVYNSIIKYNVVRFIIAKVDEDIVGCLSYRDMNERYTFSQLIKLGFLSLTGIIFHPFTWAKENYFKLGLFKNVISSAHIVTLFVSKDYQDNKIGQELMNFIMNLFSKNLTVDTRVENVKAIRFYEKNNFKIANKNYKNILLIKK